MKNAVIKSVLVLVMAFMALPMMGQDYMIIHFKNGDFRKFYLKNVTEITTSNIDADGIQQGGFNFQHIKTIYDRYTYNLEDVESITFKKVNEELAKVNFVSAMSTIFPIIDDCGSIFDVEAKIDLIKNAKGVENAWSDGHRLYVMIAEGETYTFNLNHDVDDDSYSSEKAITQIQAMIPGMKKAAENSGKKLTAVVANQQDKDKGRSVKTKLYMDLVEKFKKCNIDAKYEDNLSVDFFCHNSNNPQERNIYDYDYIFLITHGGYDFYCYNENGKLMVSKNKVHDILLSHDIGLFNDKNWDSHYDEFQEWREKTIYKDVTDHHINYSFCKETRDDGDCWVAHPSLTESFFANIADGKFKDNSILFNTSCQSLKGDSKEPSFTFADILKQKNLGVYIGYDEIDTEGPNAGYDLYYYMLTGMSLEQAFNHLTDEERHDEVLEWDGWRPHYWVANLLIYPQNDPDVEKMFLRPLYTEPIEQETVMTNFYDKHKVEIFGWATSLNPSKISWGIEYDTNDNFSSCKEASNVLINTNTIGYVQFKGELTDLEKGKTYYYRAYTHDETHHNYGNPESFTIYEKIALSSNSITFPALTSSSVQIISGSGSYSIESIIPSGIVTASIIDNNSVAIKAYTAGTAVITIKDTKSGLTATIEVTVTGGSVSLCPDNNHPHMIDLGLPSGTKWACCNVDDDPIKQKPSNYGTYYAWGELRGKTNYNESTYQYYQNGKYVDLGSDIAGTQFDVAHLQWGGSWVMPNKMIINELCDNCSSEWTTQDGVYGRKFTGPNGSTIFLPAAGYRKENKQVYVGEWGDYWSSSPSEANTYSAYELYFHKNILLDWGYVYNGYPTYRKHGHPVRPVIVSNDNVPAIQLSNSSLSLTVGDQGNVQITSGSGSYSIESIYPTGIVTASISGNTVSIDAKTAGTAKITVKDDKSGKTAVIEVTVTDESASLCPDSNHPHMIDLGLPSGTMWACCNVDDESATQGPTQFGGYYAWGEIKEKSTYSWSTYIHCDGTQNTCHDLGKDIAGTEYDVAHERWGGSWCMPSGEQALELIGNCSSEWKTINGVGGRLFTSPNGSRIFLPAAGYYGNDGFGNPSSGDYCLSTLKPERSDYNYSLDFDSRSIIRGGGDRMHGRSVRPVIAKVVVPPLQLSINTLSLKKGDQGTVEITSGSGSYSIEKIEPTGVVTASINGNIVAIETKTTGTAVITIKDNKSEQTASVEVTVSGGSTPAYYLSCPDDHHPHMIDLGLPSGTMWACCNVGATKPEDYGGYYAWGETEEKDYYDWSTYIHCDGSKETCHDLSKVVGTEYDVAHVKWGGNWVMPSYNRICELYEDCNYKWTNINGVYGVKFTGASGGSIFLPAAGGRSQDKLSSAGDVGLYWSTLDEQKYKACLLYFNSDDVFDATSSRNLGLSVRPVASKK